MFFLIEVDLFFGLNQQISPQIYKSEVHLSSFYFYNFRKGNGMGSGKPILNRI